MQDEKEFRKRVLEIFYKRSNGNSIYPIDDFRVARDMGLNSDNSKLMGAIHYLCSKGLLKAYSFSSRTITPDGIDEIENNFPTFNSTKNEFLGKIPFNINGDFIAGDKVGRDKSITQPVQNWLEKYWWGIIIPVLVGVIIFIITEGKVPQLFSNFNLTDSFKNQSSVSTTTPNLADIFQKNNSFNTSLDKQNFVKNYTGSAVYGSGTFVDISKIDYGYIVEMSIENNMVSCQFDWNYEKTLLLLKKGQIVIFSGIFTGGGLAFGNNGINPWYIKNCILLN